MSTIQDTWTAQNGAWLDKRGTLICQVSNQAAQLLYGSTGWATTKVRATVLWSTGAAGLIARYNQSGMYYSLVAYPSSTTLQLDLVSSNLNRARMVNYSGIVGLAQAQDFEMVFDANGSNLRGYVNGIKYIDWTDTQLSAGQVGLEWQKGIGQFRDIHIQVDAGQSGNLVPVTLPTDFGAYCSVDDVQGLLRGVPIDDVATADDIYSYIKQASDAINRETYSSFGRGIRVEERYDGTGQTTLVLDHSPIVKLHQLQVFNLNNTIMRSWSPAQSLGTTDDSNDLTSLIQEKNLGLITIAPKQAVPATIYATPYATAFSYPQVPDQVSGMQYDYFNRFGLGTRNIVIDYTYGYETVPEDIRWACAKMVAALVLTKRGNKDSGGAVLLTLEGMTVSFQHRGAKGLSAPYGSQIELWLADIDKAVQHYRHPAGAY